MKNRFILGPLMFFLLSINLFSRDEKISLQLHWLDQFQFAGYYIAKEKGYYKDVNLDVEIKKINNNINVVNDVSSNKIKYDIRNSSLLVDRAKGTLAQNEIEQKFNYDAFWRIGIPIISILVIIIFYLWTIKLKQEISNRRKLEKKLKASINDFKMLVNSTLEAIFILNKHGFCIEANNAAIKLFKFDTPKCILGKHFLSLIDINSTAEVVKELQKIEVVPFEVNLKRYVDDIFPGLIKSVNSSRNDKSIKIISIIDLTELKEKEGLLFQQSKLAVMGEMMSAIAHQWRQPLNAIAALNIKTETILEFNENISSEQYEPIGIGIENQLKYMSKTIDDFRDLFIPNKRKVNFSIAKAINTVNDLLSPQFKNQNITVTIQSEHVIINGYQNEFIQVIINILNNAKDAIITKKRKIGYINIKVIRSEEKNALITISDNGGGISDNIIEKIFDPYFTTKFKSQGTGIGLYMSKMIIDKSMLGKLDVKNSKEGAIFKILI